MSSFEETGRTAMAPVITIRERHKRRMCWGLVVVVIFAWIYFKVLPDQRDEKQRNSNILEGLTFKKRQFFLNRKPFRILSGAMHYFRVPEQYWRDRMDKMKACGLNTLETYVAWNMHEPYPGTFDFAGMLNIRKYILLAEEIGLYVILRPGPYICSEWDFGGLPSWLLADPNMKIRSNYKPYQEAVISFFHELLPLVTDLQYSNGGPIIAFQVENEFGVYSDEVEHLAFLKDLMKKEGVVEMLMTSDGAEGHVRAPFYTEALPTANFKDFNNGQAIFEIIKQENPDFPLMVMEFWTGWFDHWGSPHNVGNIAEYEEALKNILDTGASINFYMFHGGTNFGFMNGANNFFHYKPDVTSYDYDAPLSEAGDITLKYKKTREIILEKVYKPLGITTFPPIPEKTVKAEYGLVPVQQFLSWNHLTSLIVKKATSENLQPMEMYKFENHVGQAYGYIIYRKNIGYGNKLVLPAKVHDQAQVLLDSVSKGVFDSDSKTLELEIHASQKVNQLDIVVENQGRVNFIKFGSNLLNEERKGLNGEVKLDGKYVLDWTALALDFDDDLIDRIIHSLEWKDIVDKVPENSPGVYRLYFNIQDGDPKDTFLVAKEFKKGIAIVNGRILGRYWDKGPQRSLYVPAPFLREGRNEVLIFEEFAAGGGIYLDKTPHLG